MADDLIINGKTHADFVRANGITLPINKMHGENPRCVADNAAKLFG